MEVASAFHLLILFLIIFPAPNPSFIWRVVLIFLILTHVCSCRPACWGDSAALITSREHRLLFCIPAVTSGRLKQIFAMSAPSSASEAHICSSGGKTVQFLFIHPETSHLPVSYRNCAITFSISPVTTTLLKSRFLFGHLTCNFCLSCVFCIWVLKCLSHGLSGSRLSKCVCMRSCSVIFPCAHVLECTPTPVLPVYV